MEELATLMFGMIDHGAKHIAPKTCKMRMTNPTGIHYRPKAVRKRRKRLVSMMRQIRRLAKEARVLAEDEAECSSSAECDSADRDLRARIQVRVTAKSEVEG